MGIDDTTRKLSEGRIMKVTMLIVRERLSRIHTREKL
jgi:hypothetical protein